MKTVAFIEAISCDSSASFSNTVDSGTPRLIAHSPRLFGHPGQFGRASGADSASGIADEVGLDLLERRCRQEHDQSELPWEP
ncbi:MAG: hypothetical protein QUV05_11415 [Phycisphaerae bacterium]|nr:hypothetical protein [Phycisphaerae bacterium]